MFHDAGGRRTANVGKLAVLEDDEALPPGNVPDGSRGAVAPVDDDVAVGLEDADVVATLVGQVQQLGRGLDVGGQAEVGLFYRHEAQQVGCQRAGGGVAGAHTVGAGGH